MGGDAFGIPATRLSPAAFAALCTYITASLSGVVIAIPPSLQKGSHGDVDVLVSTSLTGLKGRAVGVAVAMKLEEMEELEESGDVDALCGALCAKVGGRRWSRNGRIVSLAVPLSFASYSPSSLPSSSFPTSPPSASHADDAFHQIDLILIPRQSLAWAEMAMTYGQTRQLLKLLCRAVGGSRLRVHDTYLGLNTPQPPLKPREEVELCVDPRRLCDWLGIEPYDASRFHDQSSTASTEEEAEEDGKGGMESLFEWLGSAPEGTLARKAYRRLALQWKGGSLPRQVTGNGDPKSKRQQKLAREDKVADEFCAWLAGRYGHEMEQVLPKEEQEEHAREMDAMRFFDNMEEYLATQGPT